MTQQIINVGTGPDSYTGESLRTAFQKVNDNFSQLYAGNVGANISGNIITANGFVTSGNVVTGNATAAGNISAYYFIGDGSQLTGVIVSANSGNIASGYYCIWSKRRQQCADIGIAVAAGHWTAIYWQRTCIRHCDRKSTQIQGTVAQP